MKEHAFRLCKGDDLKKAIEDYAEDNNIKAGIVLSCVGCLYKTVLRSADGKSIITLEKDMEIVSITGTLSSNGSHIHIAVSDEELRTYGGHLKNGCLVNTTAEVVLVELTEYGFKREMDHETGYEELVVTKQK